MSEPIRSEAAESVPAERKPTGAVAGHCFDINGDSWHKDGQVCKHCGFGVQSEQDGDAEYIESQVRVLRGIYEQLPPERADEKAAVLTRIQINERIAARLRSLPEPEWSPAYINALLEVEGLSRAVHGALVNEPEKLQCDSFCGPEECLFCDWTRALEKVSHLPSSPSRSLPVKSEPKWYGAGQMNSVEAIRSMIEGVKERAYYPDSVNPISSRIEYDKRGPFMVEAIDWLLSRVQPIANNDDATVTELSWEDVDNVRVARNFIRARHMMGMPRFDTLGDRLEALLLRSHNREEK